MTKTSSCRWDNILHQLEAGLLLITASNRQADFLKQQYRYFQQSKLQQSENRLKDVWYKPAIVTERQWISSLFQHLMFHQHESHSPLVLLSELQTGLLWEKAVETEGDFLLDKRKTADRACQAASSLHQWQLSDAIEQDERFHWRKETLRFKVWHQLVEKQCRENHWLTPYELPTYLAEYLPLCDFFTQWELLPDKIGLLGFQQITPAKQHLFDTLKLSGINFVELSPESEENHLSRKECANSSEEILDAAIWAKQQWSEDPEQRIAVVIPNLNEKRHQVQHTFDQVFCPERLLSNSDNNERPFDLSLGQSLHSYPLIDNGLTLLSLTTHTLSQNEVVQLMQSPFLFTDDQREIINVVIAHIRKSRQANFKLQELKQFSSKYLAEDEANELSESFTTLEKFSTSGRSTPAQWAEKCTDLLNNLSWTKKRPLTSSEYQTREAWHKKLEQMALFDQLLGAISWSDFRKLFRRMIGETLFQPKTGDLSVQVMGILESVSLTFDKIRICGIDNRLWPAKANPNPFLPYDLQKQYQMPNATAERELEVSQQLLATLQTSAKQVIFSHCKMDGEQNLSVSPLVEEFELLVSNNTQGYSPPAAQINQSEKLIEALEDDTAPKVKQGQIRGGSKLLQDIASCQFKAFAHHRLYARAADDAREGIDPLDRGNLVHQIMERCWRDLFDNQQQRLQELTDNRQLSEVIQPIIKHALNKLQEQRSTPLSAATVALENTRLNKLILEWLGIEYRREAFTVIANEKSIDTPLARHIIRLQIDRIDKLADGSLAIIDYKTGKVDRKNWFGSRPEEPQLPLYATVLTDEKTTIGALLYAQIKTAECQFAGVVENREQVSQIKNNFNEEKFLDTEATSLEEQIVVWRNDLTHLLEEYISGQSAVSPKDDKVCRYCDLHGLCRISEMSQRQQGAQP